MSPTFVRNKELFRAPNFARELSRVPRYVACIQTCGVRGWEFDFNILSFGFQQSTTPQHIMYKMIGGRRFFSQRGFRFQEQKWPRNTISLGFMKHIACPTQTCGDDDLHEGVQKASWGGMLGTKSAYLFLAFPLLFSSLLYSFAYIYYVKL